MMRIGLISDTHLYQEDQQLPALLAETFAAVHPILHAGDLCILSVLDQLEAIAPIRVAPQVAAFGDTHLATLHKRDDVLLVNPGSPTRPDFNQEPRGQAALPSWR